MDAAITRSFKPESFRAAVAVLALVVTGGCSAFVPHQQQITIETTPAGVPVYVDGENRGPSPVTLKLKRDDHHTITAVTGTSVYTREMNARLSVTGGLDLIGGSLLLVPGLGLLFPGAYDLDSDHVLLDLNHSPAATTRPTEAAMLPAENR